MNKYRVHVCLIFMLATIAGITETGSRKRYRKKKSAQKSVNTHMNVDAYANQKAAAQAPALPTAASYSTPVNNIAANATATPQLQNRLNEPAQQYNDPVMDPKTPAAIDKSTQPVEMPLTVSEDDEDSIELNFENADLQNFVKQIEDIFEVTFISDDALNPLPQGKKAIKNNKISFKTNKPLSKKEAWNLFVTFLDIAGFAITPQPDPKVFRITTIEAARKAPLPTFIGVDYKTLPDTDELIRYVYFLENASTETIMGIINPLRSSSSQGLLELKEHKGFILTDKAYNIKMLMTIVKELDKVSIPESMSILKLRNADAETVKNLYLELLPKEETTSRFFTKKQPTSLFFPENTRIIADPRTNTLILLGPKNAIKKIEYFIIKYIDVELDQAYSPLYTYQLKYADANTIAKVMSDVTSFGAGTKEQEFGGVRGTDQYMRPMAFIAEPETNRLIIKGHYDDYIKAEKVIRQLDAKQPQAAIEVLIASVDLSDTKSLGAQVRTKEPGPNGVLGNNIKFQTSGLYGTSPLVTNTDATTGAERLLGNLINLVQGSVPGTTFLSLGRDAFGVWGAFQVLQTVTDTEVVANPFILATNNSKATVSIGEQRRIAVEQVVPGGTTGDTVNAFDAANALLEVTITPQINSDGMIGLTIRILINDFANPDNAATSSTGANATQNTREIVTHAIVANKEVLALGGLVRNNIQNIETKVPVLGDIPILGWFFKNKRKINIKQSLLILISTNIIESNAGEDMKAFTREHIEEYQDTINYMESTSVNRDPIHRLFFQDKADRAKKSVEGLIFERQAKHEHATVAQQQEIAADISLSTVDVLPEPTYEAQNNLIRTMHNKKRSHMSLSQFLPGKEART
jgi:general secretion pathway protein D